MNKPQGIYKLKTRKVKASKLYKKSRWGNLPIYSTIKRLIASNFKILNK